MIAATLLKSDGSVLGLIGLTGRNVHNLLRGKPLVIDVDSFEANLPDGKRVNKIMVAYEFDMRELAEHFKRAGLFSAEQYEAVMRNLDDAGEKKVDIIQGGKIVEGLG